MINAPERESETTAENSVKRRVALGFSTDELTVRRKG